MGETVLETKRTEHGTILHRLSDGGSKEWRAIMAGLSMPTEEANGYFVILAEEWTGGGTVFEGQEPRRGKILLLAESEIQSPFLNDILKPLTDECSLLGCREIYLGFEEIGMGKEPDEQVSLVREHFYDKHLDITLYSAPYFKSFKTGMDIIRNFLDKALLVLPEDSLAAQQLASFSQDDLLQKPEVRFVAINGLRFAVGAFHKNRPSQFPNWTPKRKGRAFNIRRFK